MVEAQDTAGGSGSQGGTGRALLTPEAAADATRRVLEALAECRPFLQADGGDIEFVRLTPDGIAELRFTGECAACSLSKMTLRAGVERVVMRRAPEVRRVETVQ